MPADTPLHRRPVPRRALVAAVALLAVAGVVGCSSSDDEGASGATTTSVASTGSSTTGSGGSTSTTVDGPLPSSPSTLPSYDGTCAALAETYGLSEIQPKNTSSWVDERQRVVVDAQREAGLLGQAQQGAPAEIATRLATMQAYATWLSGMVQSAESYSAAVSARDAYPEMVGVSLAVATVQTWQKANCPD